MSKLILIDGSGFIFRAYHALPPLQRHDGTPVGAVYGFCNILSRFLEQAQAHENGDRIIVIFDAARQTFRQDIYPLYKAHRPEVPEDLIPQFSIIRDACAAFSIPAVEQEGYEADDIIATYTAHARAVGDEVVIVSSDKDLMQLLQPGVWMFDPIKNKLQDESAAVERFGVPPAQVIDVQALAGDATDNIPGVPGIGIKTAALLIQTFGDVETLLDRAMEIPQPKRRQNLIEHAESARISKQLVTLKLDVPVVHPYDHFHISPPDPVLLKNFLQLQGFSSLMARVDRGGLIPVATQDGAAPVYETIQTVEALRTFVEHIHHAAYLAIDCETSSLHIMDAELIGISLAIDDHPAVYIPIAHRENLPQLDLATVREVLLPVFMDSSILKIGHNIKYDLGVLGRYGFDIAPLADTMLMSYALDGGKHPHNMDELAQRHLGHTTMTYKDLVGSGRSQLQLAEVPIAHATIYAAEDADITLRLYHVLQPRLVQENVARIYETIERPLIPVIVRMERAGVKIDRQMLYQLGQDFQEDMHALEHKIYAEAGEVFNIASPKQLGNLLSHKLGMPLTKKSKTGAYVTDVSVLEKLSEGGYVLPGLVLEWRTLAKLRSTYVEGLINAIHRETGRVHTSFSMAGTSTGRLASSDPNIQNIPIRTKIGRKIRQAFICDPGWKIVSLDYSQIELRLLAHMADVPALTSAFLQGQDIHAATAADIYALPLEQVTPELRRKAKAINFGIIYGISPFGLAKQLNVSRKDAADIIDLYFHRYPGIQAYMEARKAEAHAKGFVETLFGRKCYTLGIQDKNMAVRQFAERQAINAPLQGSNADIIKRAMIQIDQFLRQERLRSRLLLQVHDELVFEMPEDEVESISQRARHIMEGMIQLKVPLTVGIGVGQNWDEAH